MNLIFFLIFFCHVPHTHKKKKVNGNRNSDQNDVHPNFFGRPKYPSAKMMDFWRSDQECYTGILRSWYFGPTKNSEKNGCFLFPFLGVVTTQSQNLKNFKNHKGLPCFLFDF